jgi:hypothetical protein
VGKHADGPEPTSRYEAVETAIRRQFQVRHDLGAREDAVKRVVPKQHQAKFTKLSDAFGAELGALRQAGTSSALRSGACFIQPCPLF